MTESASLVAVHFFYVPICVFAFPLAGDSLLL